MHAFRHCHLLMMLVYMIQESERASFIFFSTIYICLRCAYGDIFALRRCYSSFLLTFARALRLLPTRLPPCHVFTSRALFDIFDVPPVFHAPSFHHSFPSPLRFICLHIRHSFCCRRLLSFMVPMAIRIIYILILLCYQPVSGITRCLREVYDLLYW